MNVSVKVDLDKSTLRKLEIAPREILYEVASETLKGSINYTPLSRNKGAGTLRAGNSAYGVKVHTERDISIGNDVDYAVYVWNMNDSTTHWTTSGTHSAWYGRYYTENATRLITEAINKKGLK